LADHLHWPVASHFGCLILDQMSEVLEDPEVGVDLRLDSGAANL